MQVGDKRRGQHSRRKAARRQAQQSREIDRELALDQDAQHAQRVAAQTKCILVPGGQEANAVDAGQRVEFVGERDADCCWSLRQAIAGELRPVVLRDRIGDFDRLTVVQRIVTAHDALQFRKLTDHVSQQIGLGERCGALSLARIAADQLRNLRGQFLQPLDPL